MNETTDQKPKTLSAFHREHWCDERRKDAMDRLLARSNDEWLASIKAEIESNIKYNQSSEPVVFDGKTLPSRVMSVVTCKHYDQIIDVLSELGIRVEVIPKARPEQDVLVIEGKDLMISAYRIEQ